MWHLFFIVIVSFSMLGCYGYGDKVVEFGSLKLGEIAPYKPGDPTAGPFIKIPPSKFYIYVVENGLSTMCVFEECGPHGEIVECLGGWLSGDDQGEDIEAFGLDENLVSQGKSSVVVVANQDSKIVGIYPNYTMQNIPEILKRHIDLVDFRIFGSKCSSLYKVHEEYYGR